MTTTTGMSVATPSLVYAWPKSREEFDRIAADETVHEWADDPVWTAIKHDGCTWQRRCRSKSIEGGDVMVVFQWFEERPG